MRTEPKDIDEYIAGFPKDVRAILEKIRATIRKAAPDAYEKISYQIPTFAKNGNIVHFAAFKDHIGVYPAPRETDEFRDELAAYKGGKGTVQFPLDKPIPYELIGRIVKYLAKRDAERRGNK